MAQYQRVSTDPGLLGTRKWVAKWWGDTSDLRITRLSINAGRALFESDGGLARLTNLRSRNESDLHACLKFAAALWLEGASAYPDTIAHEVLCYSPIDELCEGRSVFRANGEQFDIHLPQLLYDNLEGFPLSYGHAIRIDLHSFDISIEVGGTSPFNLLTPLLDGLVDRAVWLPYPSQVTPAGFQRTVHDLGAVDAYAVELL